MPFFNSPLNRPQKRPSMGTRVMADLVGSRYGSSPPATVWSGQKYEQVLHFKFFNYLAIHAIANKVASLNPNVGRIVPAEPTAPGAKSKYATTAMKHYRQRYNAKAQTPLRDEEDLEPFDQDHALVELLNHPNQYETPFQIWYQTVLFLRLTGNAYWWTPPNQWDMPSEIHVIPAHWMVPRSYNPQEGRIIDYYDCRPIAGGGYTAMHFPADEIVHFKYDSPLQKVDGASPLAAGDRWFDIGESCDQSRWNAMKQSINSSGIIELDSNFYDPDDQEINRIGIKFLQNAGERRTGKPIILSPGMKFTPLMVNGRDLDWTNGVDQIRDLCLAMHGVHKGIVGIGSGDMSRANLDGLMLGFCANTINPETRRIDETATVGLANKFDDQARIWHDDPSPSDAKQINEDLDVDFRGGYRTKGECRGLRGLALFGDERDDEIAGVPHQEEGANGPNMDDLFAEDTPASEGHTTTDDTGVEPGKKPGAGRIPDTMFQSNGNGSH